MVFANLPKPPPQVSDEVCANGAPDGLNPHALRHISRTSRERSTPEGFLSKALHRKGNERKRKREKDGNEPSLDETFPHRTYIEIKKLSRT